MPRKTKRQKMKAQLRKQRVITHIPSSEETWSSSPLPPKTRKIKTLAEENRASSDALSLDEQRTLKYFAQDLRKSLILIGVVIALEIVLYYGSMYTYLGTILTR